MSEGAAAELRLPHFALIGLIDFLMPQKTLMVYLGRRRENRL
jgi:hypothetical protein